MTLRHDRNGHVAAKPIRHPRRDGFGHARVEAGAGLGQGDEDRERAIVAGVGDSAQRVGQRIDRQSGETLGGRGIRRFRRRARDDRRLGKPVVDGGVLGELGDPGANRRRGGCGRQPHGGAGTGRQHAKALRTLHHG